jgi:dihydrodipicolinate reductase
MSRRWLLGLAATAAAMPLLGPLTSARAHAASRRDLRFRALWQGSAIGEHRVAFRMDGDRLTVDTHIDIKHHCDHRHR